MSRFYNIGKGKIVKHLTYIEEALNRGMNLKLNQAWGCKVASTN